MYAQKGISERDCDAGLEPQLAGLSSHAALTKKRKISDSRAVVQCEDCLYTPYSFLSYAR